MLERLRCRSMLWCDVRGGIVASSLMAMVWLGCSTSANTPAYKSGTDAGGDVESGPNVQPVPGGPDVFEPDVFRVDSSKMETSIVEGGYEDVEQDIPLEASCSDGPAPEADILTNSCASPTDNECDGAHDPPNMQGNVLPNGLSGNGFDDDCDGRVDEGCDCGAGQAIGSTKECYLMPSSWTDDATGLPTGWCEENSKGTVKCVRTGGSPEHPIQQWDGECRGATPPWPDDVCSPGDFNCDGVELNPVGQDCACINSPVTCPVEPLRMNPFPLVSDLTAKDQHNPLVDPAVPFIVDGYEWIDDTVEQESTDWVWELTGGDCDNILPHPTFAMYAGQSSLDSPKLGTQVNTLGPNGDQHGFVTVASPTQHQVFPAFSLSGDYVVTGRFNLQGEAYECTVKVQVRAPGIRAELCWDHVGNEGANDVDLHFARMQGNDSCSEHGWFLTCGQTPHSDDCYYNNSSGCTRSEGPGWGYADSHNEACHGWGSLRNPSHGCSNPRLDRDNITCSPTQSDPNGVPTIAGDFCGPENINLDNPNPGDRFMVGVQCYNCATTYRPSHPHINIYCNGERVMSAGYEPSQPEPHFPALTKSGGSSSGSMWEAAYIRWDGGDTPCRVDGIPSTNPYPNADGSVSNCVDNGPQNSGDSELDWLFTPDGDYPNDPGAACWH